MARVWITSMWRPEFFQHGETDMVLRRISEDLAYDIVQDAREDKRLLPSSQPSFAALLEFRLGLDDGEAIKRDIRIERGDVVIMGQVNWQDVVTKKAPHDVRVQWGLLRMTGRRDQDVIPSAAALRASLKASQVRKVVRCGK